MPLRLIRRLLSATCLCELSLRVLIPIMALAWTACETGCSSGGASTTQKVPPPPPAAAALGGSNYGWYYLTASCNREPYGVVYNYNTATATIDSQLQQMYNNGQR